MGYASKHGGPLGSTFQESVGPFGEAEWKQKLNQLKEKWEAWVRKSHALHEQVVSKKTILGTSEELVLSLPYLRQEEGKFKMPVVNLKTGASEEVEIFQELGSAFLAEREKIKKLLEPLKPHIEETTDGNLSFKENELGWEKLGGESLNLEFLAMALNSLFTNKENMSSSQKLMIYWNLTGAAISTTGDLTTWISTKMAPGGSIAQSLGRLGRVFGGANIAFLSGSHFFDIYQALTAKDEATQVGSGIRIGFTTLGWGAMFMAEGEIYAVPAVALGGLISTVAEYFIGETESEQQFFDWLIKSYENYKKGGVRINQQSGVVEITAGMREMDYRAKKVAFSSDWIRKNVDENSSPDDASAWGSVREGLDIAPDREMGASISDAQIIVLPHTGEKYMTYRKGLTPTWLDPQNTGIPAKFKAKGIIPEYDRAQGRGMLAILPAHLEKVFEKPLPVKIILDQKNRIFVFPGPKIKGEDHYEIKGGGGTMIFTGLHSGVKLALEDHTESSTFIIHSEMALLGGEDLSISNHKLTIPCKNGKRIEIDLSAISAQTQIKVVGTSGSWKIDGGNCKLIGLDERGNVSPEELANRAKRTLDDIKIQGKTSDDIFVSLGDPLPDFARTAEEIAGPSIEEIRREAQAMFNELSQNPYRNIRLDTTRRSNHINKNLQLINAAPQRAEVEKLAQKNARKKWIRKQLLRSTTVKLGG